MADTKQSYWPALTGAVLLGSLTASSMLRDMRENSPVAKVESIESIATAHNITAREMEVIKKALTDIIAKTISIKEHAATRPQTDSNKFTLEDATDTANIRMALEFLTDLAKKKDLGPDDAQPGIEIAQDGNTVSTNVEIYVQILEQILQSKASPITR